MVVVAGVALSAVALAKADDPDIADCSGENPKNIKTVVTRRVSVLQVASQSLGPTNPNNLTGQNLNEPQNHIYY